MLIVVVFLLPIFNKGSQRGNCRAFGSIFLCKKMQRFFARNFLLTDQTRNWLTNFGRYSHAKKLLRRKILSEIFWLLGFELSVKKVASGKFFSAVRESEHRPAKNNPQSGANPSTPAREEIVGLLARFFYAKKMQRFFARNFLLTDQTRNWLSNFGRYSHAKKLLRRIILL